MSNVAVGSAAVATGLGAALVGVVVTAVGLIGRHPHWGRDARRLVFVMAAASVVAVVVMEWALITRDFTVRFVADNGSSTTPAVFNVATLWSALEGSILLWVLVLCGYTVAVVVRFRSRGDDPMLAWALLVMFIVSAFFFALMVGPAAPFRSVEVPVGYDGPGPNPLLQNHILMAFHPPILYLGYVGFTVPFAFAIAALATGRLGEGWLVATRRWTVAAWGCLTLGIVLGAWWSYETLGWGGYWAWDPVENASLLPWLTGTAFLHSVIVQERRGMLRVWNLSLIIATFSLTILGTFLTRSGVLDSVHAFTESGIGPAILGFFGVVVAVSLVLIAWRGDRLRTPGAISTPVSREGAFLANNALFAAFAFVVLLGTVFPLIVEAIDGRTMSVGNPYFDRMTRPVGLALLFLMAVAPMLPWSTTSSVVRPLSRRLLAPAWCAALVLLVAAVLGGHGWSPMLAYGLGGFAGGAALRQLAVSVRRHKLRGLTGRTNGGMVVHVGVVLVAVALASSQSYVRQAEFDLAPGQSAMIAGHEVSYVGAAVTMHSNRTERSAYVRVDGAKTYAPAIATYPFAGRTIGIPSVRSTWRDDVALSVLSFPENTENTEGPGGAGGVGGTDGVGGAGGLGATGGADGTGSTGSDGAGLATDSVDGTGRVILRVTVQPMVMWLWLGGIVMALGTVLSLLPSSRQSRRQHELSDATEGASGSQSGSGSRVVVPA